ncbi:MAG: hypothetical protein Q7R84_02140 [bacterium]|nr:hypothetical protein [bacterium]
MEYGNKTWRDVSFNDIFSGRKKNRIIGMTFPPSDLNLGLEPSVLTVLPEGTNVEYSLRNIDFNDNDVQLYVCSVYISGYDGFIAWALRHDRKKIIVGGYQPTIFPEEFESYAFKIVQGPCDDLLETIAQPGQVVKGITNYKKIPRYDLYDIKWNQQIIPDKKPNDVCTSINTCQGCPYRCDFCCSPIMAPKLICKPSDNVQREVDYLKILYPKWIFIRDENFPLQKDWRERLEMIERTGAKIYLFASANLLNEEKIKFMAKHNVYMICLGLEDITVAYSKNNNLDEVCRLLKKYGIYIYLSFIVNPLKIIGQEAGKKFYDGLMTRFHELAPEMVCGNFLMPFRGTKIWDEYYPFVSREDYKHYDSKTAFLIRNQVVREKMHFFMFWNQWLYYTSDFYAKNVRKFDIQDTLHLRFMELYNQLRPEYERIWDVRP